ncbi:LPS heptosyltransferase-1 [Polynucleobacter sp. SHI8]|uniref:lipopolysaccharide heptosyltransferase I n=1 Tax=unclassified Polynucleobacter TaxID=2640945 RepID=UPI002490C501|nr:MULTISPECIES: lipopolysaccharide heptosyltransferase I [unclassified Polynucleobacter]BDW10222.1 LPS heptosyltransferase-1 [Polynucleobacter sp. SHI2]BDW12668.1 LPS heptosyltransferase-1 [Polynucleobacter sp. SHI8]
MNILIVKLSSLGDVLHNLPIVWDIRKQYPDARLDWVIEEAYVELITPLLTTQNFKGIDHIIPLSLRRLRKELKYRGWSSILQDIQSQKKQLQAIQYDVVIETQGLLKSALITALAKKSSQAIVSGIGNRTEDSGYEPLSRLFYTKSVKVPLQYHAVDRSRAVAAGGLGTQLPNRDESPPQFYPPTLINSLAHLPNPLGLDGGSYVMCFHATARLAKSWSNDNWIAIAKELSLRGLIMVFPWGNPKEKLISEQLAKEVPNAIVPEAFSIQDAFVINAQAKLVIGVDTGLTHLAAVLGVPTIELYIDSPRWKTEGYWSHQVINLGDKQQAPTLEEVITAATCLLT